MRSRSCSSCPKRARSLSECGTEDCRKEVDRRLAAEALCARLRVFALREKLEDPAIEGVKTAMAADDPHGTIYVSSLYDELLYDTQLDLRGSKSLDRGGTSDTRRVRTTTCCGNADERSSRRAGRTPTRMRDTSTAMSGCGWQTRWTWPSLTIWQTGRTATANPGSTARTPFAGTSSRIGSTAWRGGRASSPIDVYYGGRVTAEGPKGARVGPDSGAKGCGVH